MTVTKNILFQYVPGTTGINGLLYQPDGTTLIQNTTNCPETGTLTGWFNFPVTAAVSSTLTTYKVNLAGSVIGGGYADLKEVVGTYDLQNAPTALMNAAFGAPTAVQIRQEMDSNSTQLAAIVTDIGGAGTGANAVTITVKDANAVAIQNATVTAVSGSSIVATGLTNSSGVIVLSLNNGTYKINITAATFNGSGGNSLTVSGATPGSYTLTSLSITPSSSPEVTGYLTCVDENGNAAAGVVHLFTLIGAADTATGMSTSNRQWSVQSDTSGLVQTTFLQGFNYYIKRGSAGSQKKFTAPSNNTTFQLPDCVG